MIETKREVGVLSTRQGIIPLACFAPRCSLLAYLSLRWSRGVVCIVMITISPYTLLDLAVASRVSPPCSLI